MSTDLLSLDFDADEPEEKPSSSSSVTAAEEEEEEKVYVAVGKGVNESTLTLWWAIQRFSHRKICILHVHQPPAIIFPPAPSQGQLDIETIITSNRLNEYVLICKQFGVQAEKLYLDMEMDSVEKGIVELISRFKIKKLVMGAAGDHNYDVKMLEPKSSKAIHVQSHAPPFCQIWFVCKGNLVCTREAKFEGPSLINTTMNLEAVCRANALESLYSEELRKRKTIEAEREMLKNHQDKALAESAVQKQVLLSKEQTIKELEEKVKLLEEERDEAVKLSRELAESMVGLPSETGSPEFFLTLPSSEILKAVHGSNPPSQLLCEGDLGSVYRAVLYHTEVAIRFLAAEELLAFQHEVKILSKFRHVNLATLVGACPEMPALVYEHLPNGSLEDRLRCKDDTPPLPWQTRIRIATELCSALIFLHSQGPHIVIHGALRPSCILLDSNFTCKITDFRFSSSTTSIYTGKYADPEFLDTREFSPSVDIYSFGLLLLELLTGKPGFWVVEVERALDEDSLDSLLDASAGEWSFLLAKQLAYLGLRCCDADPWRRPDLESDVWKVLEPMRLSSGSAFSSRIGEAPSYFLCPIIQEVMEEPHVAADGFTYEAEALRQWLDRGNDTSPMTNLPLEDTRLVPNKALRSAIQEWLQLQPR